MTDRQIISLLQRYMDGLTTIDEENVLAEYFSKATDDDRPDEISTDDWMEDALLPDSLQPAEPD